LADGSPTSIFRPQTRGPLVGAGIPVDALDPDLQEADDGGVPRSPGERPVELPYEVVVDGGNTDLTPPRWNEHEGWDPDAGPPGDLRDLGFLLDRDGNIVTDANGMPVLAPEPTTLLAAAGVAIALAGRRRRRN
ncbi:PEP-CTERM sorting domain-containing protein, partial [Escherichia coli]|uniref:PEP-CTERM sorting domain-containing protein n=1 Tax=Escherichia coli TaxID=562 RepID=UPI003F797F66